MTHDELREKVARVLCWADGCDPEELDGSTDPHPQWMAYEDPADAAIALVLEEAARVAENNEGKARWQGEHIAAAIRNLIPKAPESP